jgi:dsRNA-specific ribonuclease
MWENKELGRGRGQSKKQAEINAATEALLNRHWEV